MQFSTEQIINAHSYKGTTYLYDDNLNKMIIDESRYLDFAPYHIIGCNYCSSYDFDGEKWVKIVTGFFFDENMTLHRFKLDVSDQIKTRFWKQSFIDAVNGKIIVCDAKCITPRIKNRESVELICDALSLVHTYAFSVALTVMQRKKVNQYGKFMELYNDYDAFKAYRNNCKSYTSDLVLSVKTPKFERVPENKNTKTFDRIRCNISLRSFKNDEKISLDKLTDYVKTDIDNIFADAVTAIEESKRWQNFDVPINILACTYARVCRDYTLEMIFEVKELTAQI